MSDLVDGRIVLVFSIRSLLTAAKALFKFTFSSLTCEPWSLTPITETKALDPSSSYPSQR